MPSGVQLLVLVAVLLCLGGSGRLGAQTTSNSVARSATGERSFTYRNDLRTDPTWSIHVFKFDRSRADLFLTTTRAAGNGIGMSLVSEQVAAIPESMGTPLAAINGDFYGTDGDYPGDPRDVHIHQGELISAPSGHACFWMDANGELRATNVVSRLQVHWPDGSSHPMGLNEMRDAETVVLYSPAIGASTRTFGGVDYVLTNVPGSSLIPLKVGSRVRARVASVRTGGNSPVPKDALVLSVGSQLPAPVRTLAPGAELELELATSPDLAGAHTALGGGPTLVRGGKAQAWSGFQVRHPRSALGWNRTHFFMVTVDGRQPDISVGMTFTELAAYMAEIGCEEAINLDGGGSATLWVLGRVVSNPSEGRERPGANALVVLRRPAAAARQP